MNNEGKYCLNHSLASRPPVCTRLITGNNFLRSVRSTASVIINEPTNTQLEYNWI